jgi:hypothetical protein
VTTIPFGKYRGRPLAELPDAYLRWLAGLPDLREPLRSAVDREAQRRRHTGPSRSRAMLPLDAVPIAAELVTAGLHALTRRHHPDAGGDHRTMVLINRADWLREAVRGAA